jgi:hypothetical protein
MFIPKQQNVSNFIQDVTNGVRRVEGEYEITVGGSQTAAQAATVRFETPMLAPLYTHVAPVAKAE